jgi:hypothetical protein
MDINSSEWDKTLSTILKLMPVQMDDALLVDMIHFILVQYDVDWERSLRLTHIVNDLHARHTGEKTLKNNKIH